MIKRMSFGSLKASFSRRTRRRPRSTIISSSSSDGGARTCGGSSGVGSGGTGGIVAAAAATANGVMVRTDKVAENKDGDGVGTHETDSTKPQQRSAVSKSKHKGKKSGNGSSGGNNNSRGGIWKTLRHKLSKNHRQCWDAGGSNTELDFVPDDFTGQGTSQREQCRNNKPPKPSAVCPIQSEIQPGFAPLPSVHVRPAPAATSFNTTEEGVYDEPSFPNGCTNFSDGGLGKEGGSTKASGTCGVGCSSKQKCSTSSARVTGGDCSCQQAGLGSSLNSSSHSYASSNPNRALCATTTSPSNNVVVLSENGDASGSSTPAHEWYAASRLNSCAFAAISASSFVDYRFGCGGNGCGGYCCGGSNDNNNTPKIRSLTRELFKLSKYGWYWGPITRTEAEVKLMDQPDGAFLVRDSSDDRHLLSLSFRSYGKTLHTRIEHCNGLFSFYAQPEPEGHTSIVDLIEHSMNYSQSGAFCYSRARSPGSPSFPVRLTKPVSRFTQVRTLQYLCRFIIRQYTRFDHIQELPLPSRIKGYIEEGHY